MKKKKKVDLGAKCGATLRRRVAWFGVQRVQGSGCRVQGSGFRVQGAGFRVQGSTLRRLISGFVLRVEYQEL